jgi:hypothetical protein
MGCSLLGIDVLEEVHYFVGISPFIIVPGNYFEETLFAGQVVL